jgi:plastocyanin
MFIGRQPSRALKRSFMTASHRSLLIPALLLCVASACTGASDPPPEVPGATAANPGRPVDPATAGTIAGKITFTGDQPAIERLRMASDPACVQGDGPNPPSDAVLIGDDGALRNVFVHVKSGLDPAYGFPAAAAAGPVVLDQQGCRYTPRVLGVRVGQPIEIVNSDPTFHNVHALPKANEEFNRGQQVKGDRTQRFFTAPEVMVRFKCDVHGWMAAWVGVVAHPFFAVSAADGTFKLDGVPPGTYTVEAWHERFGTKTAEVTVGEREDETVAFAFAAD